MTEESSASNTAHIDRLSRLGLLETCSTISQQADRSELENRAKAACAIGDNLTNYLQVWSRSYEDWKHGIGPQKIADASTLNLFFDSDLTDADFLKLVQRADRAGMHLNYGSNRHRLNLLLQNLALFSERMRIEIAKHIPQLINDANKWSSVFSQIKIDGLFDVLSHIAEKEPHSILGATTAAIDVYASHNRRALIDVLHRLDYVLASVSSDLPIANLEELFSAWEAIQGYAMKKVPGYLPADQYQAPDVRERERSRQIPVMLGRKRTQVSAAKASGAKASGRKPLPKLPHEISNARDQSTIVLDMLGVDQDFDGEHQDFDGEHRSTFQGTQINTIAALTRLLKTYPSSAICVATIDFVSDEEPFVYDANQDILRVNRTTTDNIRRCLAGPSRFVVGYTAIYATDWAHANAFLVDKRDRSVELFEPHGTFIFKNAPDYYDKFRRYWQSEFSREQISTVYLPTDAGCPLISFQLLQGSEGADIATDPGGFCSAWSLWWLEFRLRNAGQKSTRDELYRQAISQLRDYVSANSERGSLTAYIRGYANEITAEREKILKDAFATMQQTEMGKKYIGLYNKRTNLQNRIVNQAKIVERMRAENNPDLEKAYQLYSILSKSLEDVNRQFAAPQAAEIERLERVVQVLEKLDDESGANEARQQLKNMKAAAKKTGNQSFEQYLTKLVHQALMRRAQFQYG